MSLLPRIDPDGEGLLMQFAINLSDLQGAQNGFDTFSTNGSTIQLPNINSRNFVQQAEVPNGSTLVLTGFEQVNDNADRKGTGDPSFMGLGGSQVGTRGRTAIVILMTPTVVTSRLISNE
jgi:type II secretory pathway component GspD/PulD (secretin)